MRELIETTRDDIIQRLDNLAALLEQKQLQSENVTTFNKPSKARARTVRQATTYTVRMLGALVQKHMQTAEADDHTNICESR